MQTKEYNSIKISGWEFCKLCICEKMINSLKYAEVYYLKLSDVEPKFVNRYYTPKEIDDIIDILHKHKQITDIAIMNITVLKDNTYSGMYIHPHVCFLYWMRHNEVMAIMIAQLMTNMTFHKEDAIRNMLNSEVRRAYFQIEQNSEIIDKYLPQVNKKKIEKMTLLAVKQYNEHVETYGGTECNMMRSYLFNDEFYTDMIQYICKNCNIKQIDDEFVTLMIYQRFYQIKLVWNDENMNKNLEEYFGDEIKRHQEHILPHYVVIFFQSQKDIPYVGNCKYYLSPQNNIIPLNNTDILNKELQQEQDKAGLQMLKPQIDTQDWSEYEEEDNYQQPLRKKDIKLGTQPKTQHVAQITKEEYDAAPVFKNVGKIRDAFMNDITLQQVEDPVYRRMIMVILMKHFQEKETPEDTIAQKTAFYFNGPIKEKYPQFEDKFIKYPKTN